MFGNHYFNHFQLAGALASQFDVLSMKKNSNLYSQQHIRYLFRLPFSITFVLLQLYFTSAAAKMPLLLRVRTVLCYRCNAIDFREKFVTPKRHAAPSTGSTRPAQRFGNQKQQTARYIPGSALGDRRKIITILIEHGGLIKDRQCHICKIICVIHG